MTRHIRNPIKWHGDNPRDHFTMIPNELARDTELSLHAYRIAIVIRTHAEGYELSAASLAQSQGWGRTRTRQALQELIEARWLAIRPHRTADGNRAFEEYHVHAERRFTPEEAAVLAVPVVLGGPGLSRANPLASMEPSPWSEPSRLPDLMQTTKENQQEHQSEDQQENRSISTERDRGTDDYPYCQHCEDSRVNVCGLHFHERQHRYREPDGQAPVAPSSMPNSVRRNEKRCGKGGCGQPVTPSGHHCVMHRNYIAAAAS